jgi:putative lipoprotein (rSAM/lipoprotein system)
MYMKKISRPLIKCANLLLAGLLAMLGFSGCQKDDVLDEYGAPHANYTAKGTVVNKATGKPVKGIHVGYTSGYMNGLMYGVPVGDYAKMKAYTDADGEFEITQSTLLLNPVPVYVEDLDGAQNGSFVSDTVTVDFEKAPYKKGEYTATIRVELNEEKPANE